MELGMSGVKEKNNRRKRVIVRFTLFYRLSRGQSVSETVKRIKKSARVECQQNRHFAMVGGDSCTFPNREQRQSGTERNETKNSTARKSRITMKAINQIVFHMTRMRGDTYELREFFAFVHDLCTQFIPHSEYFCSIREYFSVLCIDTNKRRRMQNGIRIFC